MSEAGIQIRGLSVRIADRVLLENADAEIPAGAVTLVIGASGAGKSVLVKILAGLVRPGESGFEISGSIRVDGHEILGSRGGADVGLVFQNFALFDELTAEENVRFALDHRRRRKSPPSRSISPSKEARELLAELDVPTGTPVRALSGGQQQRLAIARTLAFDAPVLLHDEPTSGLDPANANRVADRILETSQRHGKTTLVVTHDYSHLGRIADRVLVLDTDSRQLREIPKDQLDQLEHALPGASLFDSGPTRPRRSPVSRLARRIGRFFLASGGVVEATLASVLALIPLWRSLRWGLRYALRYLTLVASPSSCIYFMAAGSIAGFVATYFSYEFLPHKLYTEPLIGDEVLNALGFALYRIVVPVLTTILLAARCGAAVASDVGNRAYGHQLDAMRSFGVRPAPYLLSNILWSFALATPLLVGLAFLSARVTSLVVFLFHHPGEGIFFSRHFDRDLVLPDSVLYAGTAWVLAKSILCGLGVGAIAFHAGVRPKRSGAEVSAGITSTVIWATLWVLLVHFQTAFLEFPVEGGPTP